MTSSLMEKISSLMKSLAGKNKAMTEKGEELNIPVEISAPRNAETLLFIEAALTGRTLTMQDDSIGVPVPVFFEEVDDEAPKRYSQWPNTPESRTCIGVSDFEILPLTPLKAQKGIPDMGKHLLKVRPVLNDDRLECFFGSFSGMCEKETQKP